MVAYNFKKLFGEPIRWGLKTHTLRAPRAGRSRHARAKERLQLYTGLRSKHVRKILDYDPICRWVLPCRLRFAQPHHVVEVQVDGVHLEPDAFAESDGFSTIRSRAKGAWFADGKARWISESPAAVMGCFWRHEHPAAFETGAFEGELIGWRLPRKVVDAADYRARYGPPLDEGQYLYLLSSSACGLPPDLPDLGVG